MHLASPASPGFEEIWLFDDDRELIKRCLAGHEAAWEDLVRRYSSFIYSIPRRYGMSEEESEEVMQRILTVLFRKLDTIKDGTRLSGWLATSTHRECWRMSRRERASANLDETIMDVSNPPEDEVIRWEEQLLVREGLRRLGGRCEALLRALFFEASTPYDVIAERLGLQIGSIGPLRARCFNKLKSILEDLKKIKKDPKKPASHPLVGDSSLPEEQSQE